MCEEMIKLLRQMRNDNRASPKKYWMAIGCYLSAIYLTLPLTPSVVKLLGKFVSIRLLANTALTFFAISAIIIFTMRARRRHIVVIFLLGLLSVLTLWALQLVPLPIEQIHIAEYGLLSIMLYRALRKK